MTTNTIPDPWLGAVTFRSNICHRHLSAEKDSHGNCLGCVIERERENNSWWIESASYGEIPENPESEDLHALARQILIREVAKLSEINTRRQSKSTERSLNSVPKTRAIQK